MSNPFSGIPDPGMSRPPIRRRFQPVGVQQALRAVQRRVPQALRAVQHQGHEALRKAQQHSQRLWQRGKRNPRTFAVIGVAVAATLVGAYAVSASGNGGSLCPPSGSASSSVAARKSQKGPQFLLLMDRIPQAEAGSEIKIQYDVCGLRSGTPYRGKVRLSRQPKSGKKQTVTPKPLVVTFKDQVDGPATRRHQQLDLGATKPGTYTLELLVVDNQGRERKRVQKVVLKAQ